MKIKYSTIINSYKSLLRELVSIEIFYKNNFLYKYYGDGLYNQLSDNINILITPCELLSLNKKISHYQNILEINNTQKHVKTIISMIKHFKKNLQKFILKTGICNSLYHGSVILSKSEKQKWINTRHDKIGTILTEYNRSHIKYHYFKEYE